MSRVCHDARTRNREAEEGASVETGVLLLPVETKSAVARVTTAKKKPANKKKARSKRA